MHFSALLQVVIYIAYMYLNGRGVDVDHVQAYAYIQSQQKMAYFSQKRLRKSDRQNELKQANNAEMLSKEYLEQYK